VTIGNERIIRKKLEHEEWSCDTQHNDIQHNDIQLNDIQHNDIQHNDIQRNAQTCDYYCTKFLNILPFSS
jgi:hypothetical protein